MAKLKWDEIGKKTYETGVRNGVLYPQDGISGIYPLGVAWNGLTAVTESPSGAEATPIYADDIKYINLMSAEEYGATVEAYTYPNEFGICDGSAEIGVGVAIGQQSRKGFGLCYRTAFGNDVLGVDYGYKLHLIYGAMAAPSEKSYASINDSPEAITFSWAVTTTPVPVTGFKPTASLTINSTTFDSAKLAALELILFGSVGVDPRLPLPDEVISIIGAAAPAALALTASLPIDDATAVTVASNVVLTFNNKILKESIVMTKADGTFIDVLRTWDVTGKILTIDPTLNLTAASTYIVTVGGLVDIYGQTLAPVVKNFITA